jgi:peptidoglycan/xylan/chitin deacetylase (PgdA/CDA1 family)
VNKGYQPIGWTLDSRDSVGKPKSANFVAKRIIAQIKPGYITLMHVSYRHSAEALPRIFAYLDKQGLESVPVSELYFAAYPLKTVPMPAQPIFKNSFPKSALNAPLKKHL